MKNTSLFATLLAATLIPSLSFARLSDGKDHLKLKGTKINTTLDKGFHFNTAAPAGLYLDGEMGSVEPSKKTEKLIVFDAATAKDKSFTVSFYVCDDAKTVCESHEKHLVIKKGKLETVEDKKEEMVKPGTSNVVPTPEVALAKNAHGFYEDNFEKVLASAKTQNKKIFVDFYAHWCPACIRLENDTFGQPAFKEVTDEYIKVALNVDKKENRVFMKQYAVTAMPTMMILSPEGAELARFIDFKTAPVFAKEINDLKKDKLATAEELKKRAEAGDDTARTLLAERAYAGLRFDEAVKWLAPMNKRTKLLAMSELAWAEKQYYADKKKNAAQYQVAIEKVLSEYPGSIEAIVSANELAELLKGDAKEAPAKAKEVAQKNIAVIDELFKSEKTLPEKFESKYTGDWTGFEAAKLWSEKYKSADILGDEKLKKESQEKVLKLTKSQMKTDRPGAMLESLSLLKSVDLMDEALNGVEKLAKAYPKSEVYQQKAAASLARAKKYDRALPYALKSVEMPSAYTFYYTKNLAEVYQGLGRKQDALNTVEKALQMPEAKMADHKAEVASLEEMKKSLK
ncbi:MAG: thioredoxin family protein [Bdellovibrio sp.]|nr:thioredoxin family protein [Bdellovibrio sp.]